MSTIVRDSCLNYFFSKWLFTFNSTCNGARFHSPHCLSVLCEIEYSISLIHHAALIHERDIFRGEEVEGV